MFCYINIKLAGPLLTIVMICLLYQDISHIYITTPLVNYAEVVILILKALKIKEHRSGSLHTLFYKFW
jgi:hypothetical protein